jgi:hypothetical protein
LKLTVFPELDRLLGAFFVEVYHYLKSLREDDTLVIWRLDRLGRSLGDLIDLTNNLRSRRIDLESLTEKLDTGSPTGKLVFHVFADLAEFERILFANGPLLGSRRLALVDVKVTDRESSSPKSSRQSVLY